MFQEILRGPIARSSAERENLFVVRRPPAWQPMRFLQSVASMQAEQLRLKYFRRWQRYIHGERLATLDESDFARAAAA